MRKRRLLAWLLSIMMVITMIPEVSFAGSKIELPTVTNDTTVTLSGALFEKCSPDNGELEVGDSVFVVDYNTLNAIKNNAGTESEPEAVDISNYLSADRKTAYLGSYADKSILWTVNSSSGSFILKNTSGKYLQGASVIGTTYSIRIGDNSGSGYSKNWVYNSELCSMYCIINGENRYLYTDGNSFSMKALNQSSIGIYKKTNNETSVSISGTTNVSYDGNIKLPTVDSSKLSGGFSIKYSMSGNDGSWLSKESADEVNGFPVNVGSYVVYVGLFNSDKLLDVAAVKLNITKAVSKVKIVPRDASVSYNVDCPLQADVKGLANASSLSYKFAVYDSDNKLVKKGVSVNAKGLPAGEYTIKIEADAGEYINKNYDIDTSATAKLIINNSDSPVTVNSYKISFKNTDGLFFTYDNGSDGAGYVTEGSDYTFKAVVGEGYGVPSVYDGVTPLQGTKATVDGSTVYSYKITNVKANHTITASVKKLLIVNYNLNGGKASSSFQSIATYNDKSTVQISYIAPTREGYTFQGWYSSADGILYKSGSSFSITADTYLTAQWSPVTYKISYLKNGATAGTVPIDEIKYENNSTVEILGNTGNLIKKIGSTGYRFIGWTKDADGNGTLYKAGDKIQISENVSLYAQWEEGYTITYYGNGALTGTEPKDNNCYADGDVTTVMNNTGGLTKGNFMFNGWNTSIDGNGTQYEPGDDISINGKNMILYAMWRNNFKVTYNANGAKGNVPVDDKYYNSNETVTVEGNTGGLTNGGNKFAGWNTNPSGNGTLYIPGAKFKIQFDTTLYAQWGDTLNVTYSANGGEGTVPYDNNNYESGDSVTVKGKPASLSKANCTFNGWFIDTNGDGVCETGEPCYSENETFAISKSVELKANWNGTLNVTYIANGLTEGTVPIDNIGYSENSMVTVLGNVGGLKKGNLTLAGWTTDPSGYGTLYKAGDKFQITKNVTLYAKWSETFSVTYYAGSASVSGTVPEDSTKYTKDDVVTVLDNVGGLTNGDAVFGGWNTRWDGKGTTYLAGAQFKIDGNVDLYPVWGITYNVTYDKNGGTGSVPIDSTYYKENAVVTVLDNIGSLSKKGYSFSGWFVDFNNDGEWQSGEEWYCAGAQFRIDKNVTLKARWGSTYNVYYDKNGGEEGDVPTDPKNYTAGSIATVYGNINGLIKKGYIFNGWFVDRDLNGICDSYEKSYQAGSQIEMNDNITLNANWSKILKVTYDMNSDEATGNVPVDKTEYIEGKAVTVLGNTGNLKRPNYTFNGWFIDKNNNNRYDELIEDLYFEGSEFTIENDVTLKANWGKTYTVKYMKNGADSGALPTESESYAAGSKVTVQKNINNLQKTNYYFSGWFIDEDGNGKYDYGEKKYAEGEEFTILDDVTLLANWEDTYTVTYFGNNQTGGSAPVDYTRYRNGDIAKVKAAGEDLKKTGFIFDGWILAGDSVCDTTACSPVYKENDEIKVTGNILLKAKWSTAYTITYNANGASEGTVPKDNGQYAEDSTTIVKGNTGGLKNGNRIFAGWCTDKYGNGIIYKSGDEIQVSDNLVLYAQWSEVYTVTYEANGIYCTVPSDPKQYAKDDVATVLGSINGLCNKDKLFNGWFIDANNNGEWDFGETRYLIGETFYVSGNVTLKANWSDAYSVTYDSNDATSGYAPEDNKKYSYDDEVTVLGNTSNLKRSNYVFNGWYIDTNNNDIYEPAKDISYSPGAKFNIKGDVVLKANWSDVYKVTYESNNADSGSVPYDAKEYAENGVVTVLDNIGNLQKEGYIFNGWYIDENNSHTCDYDEINYAPGATFNITGNVTLRADWDKTYRVIYNRNGATGGSVPVDGTKYNLNEVATVYGNNGNLTRDNGLIFDCWNTKADGSGTDYYDKSTFKVTKNTVLYAQWKTGDYTVTYNDEYGNPIKLYNDGMKYKTNYPFKIDYDYEPKNADDYIFVGWKNSYDGNIYWSGESFNMPGADVVLTAIVEENDKFNLSFDANSAKGIAPDTIYETAGTVVVIPDNDGLRYDGYRFTGWNTRADGKGTNYEPGNKIVMPEKNLILYAQWAKEYTVRFVLGNGAGKGGNPTGFNEQTVILGDLVTPVTALNKYTENNGAGGTSIDYYFNGWKNQNGNYWSFEHDTVNKSCFDSNGVMVLTAQWDEVKHYNFIFDDNLSKGKDAYVTINGKRTYDANGNFIGTYKVYNKAYNDYLYSNDIPEFDRIDYKFNGWYFDSAYKYDFNPANKLNYYSNLEGYADPRDNTITLYAAWTAEYDGIGSVFIDKDSLTEYGTYAEYYSDWISARSADGSTFVYKNFYISSGSLPTGLTLNSRTGEIYGVPIEEGEFTFHVMMTNDEGIPIAKPMEFTITIQPCVLTIDHNSKEYSKNYGTADPEGLLNNNQNLTISTSGSGDNQNVSGISISGSDNTVTVKYDYSENIYKYSAFTNSFKKATTRDELVNYMRYASDLSGVSLSESRKDIFRMSFKRQIGEDAGKYKLYMEKNDVKLIKKNGLTINASGDDISGYDVEIAGGFQSKSAGDAASKYVFTIIPADLVINSVNNELEKIYGENDPSYTINTLSLGVSNAEKVVISDSDNIIYISYNGGGNANFTDTLETHISREFGEDVGTYQIYMTDKDITGRGTTKITTPVYDKDNPIQNYNLIISESLTKGNDANTNCLTIKKRSIGFVVDGEYVYGELKPGSVVTGHFSEGSLARNDSIKISDTGSITVNSTAPLSTGGYLKVNAIKSDPDTVLKVAAINSKFIIGAGDNTTKSSDTSGNYSVLSMDNFVIAQKATTIAANTVKVTKGNLVSTTDILNLTKCTDALPGDVVNAKVLSYKINNVEYKTAAEAANAIGTFTNLTSVTITYSGLIGADSENYSIPEGTFTITSKLSSDSDNSGGGGGGGGGGGSSTSAYSITCTVGKGGYLLPSPDSKGKIEVVKGSDQKIEIICDKGYSVSDVKVDGKSVGNTANYTFENIKKSHTFAVTFKNTGFAFKSGYLYCLRDNSCPIYSYKDSNTMDWYHDGVHFCLENGIMNGMTYSEFAPNGTATRAMLVTILYRIDGSPTMTGAIGFTDVDTRGWYYDAVRWANRNGIVEGYNTKTFGPNDNITREQLAVILARYAEYKGVNITKKDSLNKFTDVDQISNWALGSIQWAVKAGLIKGKTETTIEPISNATRAEIATLIMRFCENYL